MIKVHDRWLRIALIAIPSLFFALNFIGPGQKPGAKANIVYIIATILVCESSRLLIYKSRQWFAPPHRRLKRLLVLIPTGVLLVTAIFLVSKILRNYFAFGQTDSMVSGGITIFIDDKPARISHVITSLFYAFWTFLALLFAFELAWHFARLRHVEKERDRLEKEKLEAELQQLKGIVNPHFLFNNLNSLSSLISENPQQAEAFLDELTKVFRYLLRNNETTLTTLSQELQFIQSYYHLLQTRYGKGISLELNIDPTLESYLLPPLTLQLLLENAVKHNRIQKEAPLRIEVYNEAKHLVVRNNVAPREQSVESTGIGLRSIKTRYELLGREKPTIDSTPDFFSVAILLIAPEN